MQYFVGLSSFQQEARLIKANDEKTADTRSEDDQDGNGGEESNNIGLNEHTESVKEKSSDGLSGTVTKIK
ncbi:hypothetical protein [Chitinophaga sancti]|uniref:Uncharacterized protein n=1 Tax=Chitinophaga sancti TaxID=1004 RepID=A0A1K1QE67_9BACT|nr:hypothetical protein [Chitinophaga sancti]WQD61415.1 hypothetical protein U0033_26420 [Chitinophaga sancti]WQG93032.1 hypothetical protein SR876_16040 [Chitinophaga sancti]SFW57996.1 hypothetical protein SAMN05661012_02735 [Chitinophaga sancti]